MTVSVRVNVTKWSDEREPRRWLVLGGVAVLIVMLAVSCGERRRGSGGDSWIDGAPAATSPAIEPRGSTDAG